MSSSPRRSAPVGRVDNRNVRQHARPIRANILRDTDAVVKCLERAVPDVEFSLSGSKKKKNNTFDFDAMVKDVNNLRDRHGTSKMEDYREDALKRIPKHLLRDPSDSGGGTNEGPVLGWFAFFDPSNPVRLIYAKTAAQAEELRQKNYHEFTEGLCYNDPSASFPPAGDLPAAAAATAGTAAPVAEDPEPPPLHEQEPPAALWQPNGYVPKIRKEGDGSNRAKYIEYFEEKVVCEETEQVYSPMRRWDKSKFSKDSTFNSRLLQYYVAKNDLRIPGGKDSLDNIKKVGRAHAKDKYGGEEKFTRGGQLSYFEICLSLYEDGLSADA